MSQFKTKLSHRGHIDWAFFSPDNSVRSEQRINNKQKFDFKFGNAGRRYSGDPTFWPSFREECTETAKMIRDNTDLPIGLLVSGGIDSEVMLKSFVFAGIPVTAYILSFDDKWNVHDIAWAIAQCETLGVKYKVVDVDIMWFMRSMAMDYANRYNCASLEPLSTMWLVSRIDDFPVLANGDAVIRKEGYQDWKVVERECIFAHYIQMVHERIQGVPAFFQYTPELMLNYAIQPAIRRMVDKTISPSMEFPNGMGLYGIQYAKYGVYKEFDIAPRPKYTGYEKLDMAEGSLSKLMRNEIKTTVVNDVIEIPYEDYINQLLPNI